MHPPTGRRGGEERHLLLSIPVRGDGTLDELESPILDRLGTWMAREGEAAIYGSRPWHVFGEEAGGGVRYTVKGGALHALLLKPQAGSLKLAALGGSAVERVTVVGGDALAFAIGQEGLEATLPGGIEMRTVPVLRIDGRLPLEEGQG